MDHRHALLVRRNVAIAGAALLVLSLLGALLWRLLTPAYDKQFTAATTRWESRSFSHYRLVMQAPGWCRVDVEVRDEQVVAIFQNTCPIGVRTVTGLFELIKQLDGNPETRHCAPAGCGCIEVQFAQVVYDDQFGFPRTTQLRRQREPNWPLFRRYLPSRGLSLCLTPPTPSLSRCIR